jgi:hypothetical protein
MDAVRYPQFFPQKTTLAKLLAFARATFAICVK